MVLSKYCPITNSRRNMRRRPSLHRQFRGLELKVNVACVCFVCILYVLGLFESFDQAFLDFQFRLRGELPISNNVVVVGIDEQSLTQYGKWPWPRSLYAMLISAVAEMKPCVIGMDISFSDPEGGEGDVLLSEALKTAGNVVLPAYPESLKVNQSYGLEGYDWSIPLEVFSSGTQGLGHIVVIPEYRQVVRRIPLVLYQEHKQIRSLSYELARSLLGESNVGSPPEMMYLNYSGLQGDINIISCADILNGDISAEAIQGRVVIIGLTARGINDFYPTPFIQTSVPGVLLHALATENIVAGSYVSRVPMYIVIFVLFGLTLLYLIFRNRYEPLCSTAIAVIIVILVSYALFLICNIWFDIAALIFLGVAQIGVRFVFNYLSIVMEKQNLKKVFGRYVSERILERIIRSETFPQLGGVREYISIVFADLRGFTSFAEDRQPEEVILTLNTYLTAISECILKSGGTVDKYTGDGVMGLFGTPLKMENSAKAAQDTAVSIQKAVSRINKERRMQNMLGLQVGIGIATGEVIVGNIGSPNRMDYTAVGDAVNLAARLEELAGAGQILIDEESWKMLQDERVVLSGVYRVKGKEQPVQVYQIECVDDW
jgi:adenylate cyclase